MPYLLQIINLKCSRSDDVVIRDFSLEINRGENIEIIGSNGSGKTTLLKAILGLLPDLEGEILWQGTEIKETGNFFLKSCFYQGHKLGIKSTFTVLENLKYSNFPLLATNQTLSSVASRVGIGNFLHRATSDLSIGQTKRIALARWLIKDFDLYLIDEPFTALDDEGSSLIHSIIKELNSRGSSFLITGHRKSGLHSKKIYLNGTNES